MRETWGTTPGIIAWHPTRAMRRRQARAKAKANRQINEVGVPCNRPCRRDMVRGYGRKVRRLRWGRWSRHRYLNR